MSLLTGPQGGFSGPGDFSCELGRVASALGRARAKSFNFSVITEASIRHVGRDLGRTRHLGRRQTHVRIGRRRRRDRRREPSGQRLPVAGERPRLARHRVDGLTRGAVEDSQRHRRRAAAGLEGRRLCRRAVRFGGVGGRDHGGVHGHFVGGRVRGGGHGRLTVVARFVSPFFEGGAFAIVLSSESWESCARSLVGRVTSRAPLRVARIRYGGRMGGARSHGLKRAQSWIPVAGRLLLPKRVAHPCYRSRTGT